MEFFTVAAINFDNHNGFLPAFLGSHSFGRVNVKAVIGLLSHEQSYLGHPDER